MGLQGRCCLCSWKRGDPRLPTRRTDACLDPCRSQRGRVVPRGWARAFRGAGLSPPLLLPPGSPGPLGSPRPSLRPSGDSLGMTGVATRMVV